MIPKELFKKIRRVEIRTKGLVHDVFGGEYHSAFKGRGMAFAEVRPYQIGDEIRNIDWNVSARTGEAFVKVYEEEREQTVLLIVDVSGSEQFGTAAQTKREMAAEVCAVLAFSAVQNQDNVGLLLFSDQVEGFVPPKKGRRHVLRLLRDLFAQEPADQGTDLAPALRYALRMLRRRAVVVLVSDFLAPFDYEQPLRMLAKKHDVVAVRLHDPREAELPDVGLLRLIDAETGAPVVLDTSSERVRRAYAKKARRHQDELDALFKRVRLDAIRVETDGGFVDPLVQFFRRRNRARR